MSDSPPRRTPLFSRLPTSAWRWLLFCGGFAVAGACDAALAGPDGVPLVPALGAWCLAVGWLWGTAWLAATVAAAAAFHAWGLGPAPVAAVPGVAAFALAALVLRFRRVVPVRWSAAAAAQGGGAALAAVSVAAAAQAAIGGAGPEFWTRAVLAPAAGAVLWLFPLAALVRLAEPRMLPSPARNRWGWPTRPAEAAGLAAVAAFAALAAESHVFGTATPAVLGLAVLSAGLAFNLVGGTVCALAAALAAEPGTAFADAAALNATLAAVALAAGGFAGTMRERMDETAHNMRRYRALLESLPIGLVELDERGLITQANPMAGTIVGCAAADLLGLPFDRLGAWEARPVLAATTRAIRYMRQPEARFVTSFLYRPDSTTREVQVDWVYQRSERRRRPLRITALITDITARSRALQALKDREHELAERTDLLRITMDALDHGLAAFSPHNTLTEWNARFPAMLNLPSPLARNGTPAIAIFRFLATLGAFGVGVTEGKVRARMNRLLHAPNQDDVPWLGGRHLRFSAHTMPDGGWVWRIEDRTEDLRLRDIEQNRQKMEALGQLASGVAHELNNTLQPIFSLSELGLSQIDEGTLASRCFSRITDAAERAETIVRGVLTFARNAPASDENTRVVSAIHDAVAFIRTGLPPQIRLDVAVDDAIPASAMARLDRRELGQVLTNLVTNAADAMDHTGVIRVECRGDLLLTPGEGEAGEPGGEARPAVAIAVIDTGKGMDHATKQRIFEPFFTTKDEGHGTGLGLAVAFGIVRNWGGRIDVDSDPGLGSTFTVWVPLLETDAA